MRPRRSIIYANLIFKTNSSELKSARCTVNAVKRRTGEITIYGREWRFQSQFRRDLMIISLTKLRAI